MKRPEEQKKRKRVILLLASLFITAVFAGSAVFSINAMGEAPPQASVSSVNEERSQLLVSGKNYSLEKEQEELYSVELEREEEIREEEKEEEQKEENQPEEVVESIITEEKEQPEPTNDPEVPTQTPTPEPSETPTPEPTIPQTPTPEPTDSPTPEPSESVTPTPNPSETVTPTPEPGTTTPTPTPGPTDTPVVTDDPGGGDDDGKPGDEGTPVPSDGPDDGHDGDGEGEGEEGDDPTPTPTETPTEPPVIDYDPVIECSLSDTTYSSGFAFTVRGQDYRGNVIESFNYKVWMSGVQLFSSGTDGAGYVTYHPEGQTDTSDGSYEITVTVTDAEGHSSSKTYSVTIQNEQEQIAEEYVSITVDAGSIYESGSYILVSDTVQIYPGETVDRLVDRTLRTWGYDPQASYDSMGYYLARIARAALIDLNLVKEDFRELIFTVDSLGERDVTSYSGWLYSYNGSIARSGMSAVTLGDGDEIYIWFDLNGLEY